MEVEEIYYMHTKSYLLATSSRLEPPCRGATTARQCTPAPVSSRRRAPCGLRLEPVCCGATTVRCYTWDVYLGHLRLDGEESSFFRQPTNCTIFPSNFCTTSHFFLTADMLPRFFWKCLQNTMTFGNHLGCQAIPVNRVREKKYKYIDERFHAFQNPESSKDLIQFIEFKFRQLRSNAKN